MLGECLLISSLPGKSSGMLVDIARLAERFNMRSRSRNFQFTSWLTLQTSEYDVIIEFRVDSMSLTTSF